MDPLVEVWEESGFEIVDVIQAGNDLVVVTRAWGKGRDGIEVDRSFANLAAVRDGSSFETAPSRSRSRPWKRRGCGSKATSHSACPTSTGGRPSKPQGCRSSDVVGERGGAVGFAYLIQTRPGSEGRARAISH